MQQIPINTISETAMNAAYQNIPAHVYGNVGPAAQQHGYSNLDMPADHPDPQRASSGASVESALGRFHSVAAYTFSESDASLQLSLQHEYAEPKLILCEEKEVGIRMSTASNFEGYAIAGGYAAIPSPQGFDYRDPADASKTGRGGGADYRVHAAHDYREFSGVSNGSEATYGDVSSILPSRTTRTGAIQNDTPFFDSEYQSVDVAAAGTRTTTLHRDKPTAAAEYAEPMARNPKHPSVLVPEPTYQLGVLEFDSSSSGVEQYDKMTSSSSNIVVRSGSEYAAMRSASSASALPASPSTALPHAVPKVKVVQIYGSMEDTDDEDADDAVTGEPVVRKSSEGIYETYENTAL